MSEGTKPQGDGDYRRTVQSEMRVRCIHLMTKGMFVGVPSDHERAFEADDPIWWCDKTSEPLGPDGSPACHEDCHGAPRSCYEGPVRL